MSPHRTFFSRMRLLLFPFLLLPLIASTQMQEVQIGLLRDRTVKQVIVLFGKGGAEVQVDGRKAGELVANDGIRIEATATGLEGRSLSATFPARQRLTLIPKAGSGGFRMRALDGGKMAERSYPGWFEVRMVGGRMVLVNQVKLEEYVAGVVQAEAGRDQAVEYYKLQAVSCRTYALANLRRHAPEGFELCDGVHCQVYHGRSDHDAIAAASRATRGMVAVDASIRLIHATFHSNCGGETMNAEDLWSKPEPYLRSTLDTFCLASPHATWQRSIARGEWLGYLQRKYDVPVEDKHVVAAVTHFTPNCRELYLPGARTLVPVEDIRADWKLNSAYFSIEPKGEEVILSGRGFGHGVGVCQEGAMNMARSGRSFVDILHHYYAEVHLVDLSTLDFFRDEGE